ncbi:MAG: glycoside hydrolase family 18 protein [Lachnospiraceae bacterium]|nr:glycoside hydrolase family 18 protein [Lachnospiraceae bacterium]
MGKLIGYVDTGDLKEVTVDDVNNLDVINIAFGHIRQGRAEWNHPECKAVLSRIKSQNPEIKILLSIGGWGAGGFSEAAMTEEGRKRLAASAVDIVQEYDLDGLDIDWEYPCFRVAGIDGSKKDKENFTLLIEALRNTLDKAEGKKYLLTIAAGGDEYFTVCTEMDKVQKYLNYVQVMTYDLKGGFLTFTGHHTSLYSNQRDLFPASADKAVECFLRAGVPKEKLVIGAAYYSRVWKKVPNVDHGLHQMAGTTGGYGPAYHRLVRDYINKNGYTRYWDDEAKAPYLFNGKNFISYDDEESLKAKAEYVAEKGLLGIMYWEYGCDATHTLTGWLRKQLDLAEAARK